MKIEKRIEKAMSGKEKGYTCCQCVIMAIADLLDVDEISLFKISEGFGGGVGGLEEICGVVSAMAMAAGLVTSSGNLEQNTSKVQTIELTKELAMEFKELNKTVICRELRGTITGVPIRDCDDCIQDGVRILTKTLYKFNK